MILHLKVLRAKIFKHDNFSDFMGKDMPQTLVRTGVFYDNIEDLIGYCILDFISAPSRLGNSKIYISFNPSGNPYLMIVSQQIDRKLNLYGYNVSLTVTSFSRKRNNELADQFEAETGIELKLRTPRNVIKYFQDVNLVFSGLMAKHRKD